MKSGLVSRRDFLKVAGVGPGALAVTTSVAESAAFAVPGAPGPTTVIDGGTLIDGTGAPPIPDCAIVIEGGRIARIGKAGDRKPPAGVPVFNARGKYIIPGLIDAHVHYDEPWLHRLYLAGGVTCVRDMSMALDRIATLRQEINLGNILAPRMWISGVAINPATVKSLGLGSAREMAQKMIDAGVDGIKVTGYTVAELKEIAAVAHAKGLRVYGHTGPKLGNRAPGVFAAVEAGLDGVEHMYGPLEDALEGELQFPPGFDSGKTEQLFRHYYARLYTKASPAKIDTMISLMVKKNVYLSPTFITTDRRIRGTAAVKADPEQRQIPGKIADLSSLNPADDEERENWKKTFELMKDVVGKFQKAGGLLIAGTDSSGGEAGRALYPGASLHREMELMAESGLTPLQALQTATLNNARMMGKEKDFGSVENGKFADLVILDADPLATIASVRKVYRVVRGGALLDPAALLKENREQFGSPGEKQFSRSARG